MDTSVKPFATYDEQIVALRKHHCVIDDEEDCKAKLATVGYYRLTAYFLPFKNKDKTYVEGTNFDRVFRLYEFDRKLRHIVFSAVEEIEVFLRTQFAYYHAEKYGPIGYLDAANFSAKHKHDKFISTIEREVENNENVLFVRHHKEHRNGVFPLWVMSELFTFGMLSFFYHDLHTCDKKSLAKALYNENYHNIMSWLRCCTDLRNICAHYGRLYYRVFSAIPSGFDDVDVNHKKRLWGAMLALKSLYPSADKWNGEFMPQIEALFEEYDDAIDLYHMAFPKNWKEALRK